MIIDGRSIEEETKTENETQVISVEAFIGSVPEKIRNIPEKLENFRNWSIQKFQLETDWGKKNNQTKSNCDFLTSTTNGLFFGLMIPFIRRRILRWSRYVLCLRLE